MEGNFKYYKPEQLICYTKYIWNLFYKCSSLNKDTAAPMQVMVMVNPEALTYTLLAGTCTAQLHPCDYTNSSVTLWSIAGPNKCKSNQPTMSFILQNDQHYESQPLDIIYMHLKM